MEVQHLTELVIASRNIHKIREFKEMLSPFLKIDLLSLLNFPDYLPPEEAGLTFKDIAINKAVHAAKALNKWVIADDSGLVVPSLKGAPGIYSSRYAGNSASDSDNRKKLLSHMENLKKEQREAYFECCLALSSPESLKKCVCASCEGTIAEKEKGGCGFGYDPVFIKNDYNKTFSELNSELKNKISHRRKALDKILPSLESIIN